MMQAYERNFLSSGLKHYYLPTAYKLNQRCKSDIIRMACNIFSGVPGCGGLLTSPAGEFTSPQHPQTYQNNLDCEWVIRVPRGDRIKIVFLAIDIESHYNCV